MPPLSHWQPFQEVTNQRLTEEDTQIGIRQKGGTIQHPHPAEPPDKGQDQDKNGREGQKNKSRVVMHLQVFDIIQDPALSA